MGWGKVPIVSLISGLLRVGAGVALSTAEVDRQVTCVKPRS